MTLPAASSTRGSALAGPHQTVASLFVQVMQRFRDALNTDDFEIGDLVLLNYVSSAPNWREGVVDFLLNITGDDPQRVLDRALDSGRLLADQDGHLHATDKVGQLMSRLGPTAQEFNQAWRKELSSQFSPQALELFLTMLQHASGSEPEEARDQ